MRVRAIEIERIEDEYDVRVYAGGIPAETDTGPVVEETVAKVTYEGFTIRLPEGAKVTLDSETGSADVTLDFTTAALRSADTNLPQLRIESPDPPFPTVGVVDQGP